MCRISIMFWWNLHLFTMNNFTYTHNTNKILLKSFEKDINFVILPITELLIIFSELKKSLASFLQNIFGTPCIICWADWKRKNLRNFVHDFGKRRDNKIDNFQFCVKQYLKIFFSKNLYKTRQRLWKNSTVYYMHIRGENTFDNADS